MSKDFQVSDFINKFKEIKPEHSKDGLTLESMITRSLEKKTLEIAHLFNKVTKKPSVFSDNPNGLTMTTIKSGDWVKLGFQSDEYCYHYGEINGILTDHMSDISALRSVEPMCLEIKENISIRTGSRIEDFLMELSELGFIAVRNWNHALFILDEKNLPIAYLYLNLAEGNEMEIKTVGRELMVRITDVVKRHYTLAVQKSTLTKITGVQASGLTLDKEVLDQNDNLSPSTFYPWMNGYIVADYFQDYLESKESILLLYGLPGTGKSSLIRTGLVTNGANAHLLTDANLSADPKFVTKLIDFLSKVKTKNILIVEDADALLRPRSEGNLALSTLLDAAAGIGRNSGFKLIITTNKPDTSGIDPAVLRHGRCYDIMKFGKLTPDQAAMARASIGLEPKVIRNDVTLAQALSSPASKSMKSAQDETVSIVSPRFPLSGD